MSLPDRLRERAERHARRKRLPIIVLVTGLSIVALAQTAKFLHQRGVGNLDLSQITDNLPDSFSIDEPKESGSSPTLMPSPTTPASSPPSQLTQLFQQAADWPSAAFQIAAQQWTQPSGSSIYFMPAPDLPMLDLRLIFNAGSARDDKYPGLANLTAALLDQGTRTLNTDQIAEKFEALGSQFSVAAYRDMAVMQLRCLTEPKALQESLALVADILANPSFPADALQRTRQQMLLGLQQEEQQPQALIQRRLWQVLYPNHPYGQSPTGTAASLNSIQISHIKQFYQQYYVSANAVMALVGALDREAAQAIAQQLLGQLPPGQPAPILPAPAAVVAQHIHIPFQSQQTHIQVAALGIDRSSADYAQLYLANEVLGGGGFNSRLNQVIREDKGLAYSVGSYFVPMQTTGPFIISLQTRNEQAGNALQSLQQVVEDMLNQPIPEAELNNSKQHLLRSYPLGLSNNLNQVSQLASLAFYHLPPDTLNQFPGQISQVAGGDIQQILKKLLSAEQRVVITLGPTDPLLTPTSAPTAGSEVEPTKAAP